MTEDLVELWILEGGDYTFGEFLEVYEAAKKRYTQSTPELRELYQRHLGLQQSTQQQLAQQQGLQQGQGRLLGNILGGLFR